MAKRDSLKDFQKQTNKYAKRSIESMRDDLAALEHARECDGTTEDGTPCKAGSETRRYRFKDRATGEIRRGKQMVHNNEEAWHDEERARAAIDEGPLEVACDKGERFDGTRWYMILLGTGGPAARIIGQLSEHHEPESATFQFQDWFKPWTDAQLSSEDEKTLLEFAQHFNFEGFGHEDR